MDSYPTRAAQIIRLRDGNARLRQRVTDREQEISDPSAFKTTALSRLAAQHQEITALRAAIIGQKARAPRTARYRAGHLSHEDTGRRAGIARRA
jgi:hypothetical protein